MKGALLEQVKDSTTTRQPETTSSTKPPRARRVTLPHVGTVRVALVRERAPAYPEPITNAADVYRLLGPAARTWDREHFISIVLDGKHRVVAIDEVAIGTAPEFQAMLTYCAQRKGRISYVVVYDLSRFARETYDHKSVAAYLKRFGIRLRSVTQPIDESPAGAFMETIFSAVAQLDNDMRADRTRTGMQAAVRSGRWPFAAPLGYLKHRDGLDKANLLPDPDRADHVRWIFETYATGLHSKNEVLRMVNQRGLRTHRGTPLSQQTFHAILRNRLYTGQMAVAAWDMAPVQGSFEPLVSEDLFERAQAVLEGRAIVNAPNPRRHEDFPLRDLVHCGACRRPLTAAWSTGRSKRRYGYYRCWKRDCQETKVSKDELEGHFVDLLGHLTLKPEYLRLFHETVVHAWHERLAQASHDARAQERRLTDLRANRDRLEAAYVYEQKVDAGTYTRQKQKLDHEILSAEMAERESRLEELDVEGVLGFAETLLAHPAKLWREFSIDQKLRFQQILFPSGLTYRNRALGTAGTSLLFRLLRAVEAGESGKGSFTIPTWNQLHEWLEEVSLLKQALAA